MIMFLVLLDNPIICKYNLEFQYCTILDEDLNEENVSLLFIHSNQSLIF